MKESIIFGLIFSTLYLVSSCNNSPKYEKLEADIVENLNSQVLNDSFPFGGIDGIWVHDSILIISDYKQEEKLQFFNNKTGQHLGSAVCIGQGDKEVVSIYNTHICPKAGIFTIYDKESSKVLACKLSDILRDNWFTIKIPQYTQRPNELYFLNFDEFFASHGLTRFTKARDGEVIAKMNEYPDIPDFDNDDQTKRMFFLSRTYYAIRPDGKKFVQASYNGSLMQILDIKESSIEPAVEKYYQKPIYNVIHGQIAATEETIYGFMGLSTTDKYIYALHLGNTNLNELPKDIYIFDWEGNIVKKLHVENGIQSFCVDENNNKIYAVALNEDKEQILVTMDYKI